MGKGQAMGVEGSFPVSTLSVLLMVQDVSAQPVFQLLPEPRVTNPKPQVNPCLWELPSLLCFITQRKTSERVEH